MGTNQSPSSTQQAPEARSPANQTTVVREHFRDASAHWGARYAGQTARMSDLDLILRRENVHRFLRAVIDESDRVVRIIDVGCGSGDVLDGVARDSVRVVGADLVPEMVAEAARNHPADRFVAASGDRLPFAPSSADVVTCLGMLEYVPDPGRVLDCIRRILEPGGSLIISFPNAASLCRRFSDVEIAIERRFFAAAAVLRGRRRNPRAVAPRYQHRQWSVRQAESLLEGAGFRVAGVRLNTFGLWGAVGRLSPSLALSALLSRRFGHKGVFSSRFACTMVFDARTE